MSKFREPLSVTHPQLCEEWSERNFPFTPDNETAGSHDKVWWKGKCGHEWNAQVSHRALQETGCPYCTHRKVLVGFNDLASTHPRLVGEWSERNAPLTPQMFMPHSRKRVWWRCEKGHEWETTIAGRTKGNNNCPVCSNKKLVPGINDFATAHPELASRWSGNNEVRPDQVRENYYGHVLWICPHCGNEYQMLTMMRLKGYSCPYCRKVKLKTGFNDIGTLYPEIAATWDPEKNGNWKPELLTEKSGKFIWWRCEFGHSFGAKVRDRILNGKGCSVCEQEFLAALPSLLAIHYAEKKGLAVKVGEYLDSGLQLGVLLPGKGLAIELEAISEGGRRLQMDKKEICEKDGIRVYYVKKNQDPTETDRRIREILDSTGIQLTEPADLNAVRENYFRVRREMNKKDGEING